MVLRLQPLCFGLQIAPAEPMSNSFAHQARSSLEACGIDVYTTVRQVGWEIEAVQTPQAPFRLFGLVWME